MADLDPNDLIKPDEVLRALWEQRQRGEITESQYSDASSKRMSEIMKETGYTNLGAGSLGYILPGGGQAVGKTVLSPYEEKGIYAADKITSDTSRDPYGRQSLNKTNDPAAIGTANYDPNATNLRTFYDESGKQLSASQVAATKTGQAFASAGWDIGFGPGMIGPGIKAAPRQKNEEVSETKSSNNVSEPRVQSGPSPTPPTPAPLPPPPPPVKTAPIDTILFDDSSVPIEIMTDLIFEDIGGQEIISIVRNDTVNGQDISYQPIKNISLIQKQYNPNNIIALQNTSDKYFNNFYIKLAKKIPTVGNGQNGNNVYFDLNSGNIIIDTIDMESDEQIETEFLVSGTIYEADI